MTAEWHIPEGFCPDHPEFSFQGVPLDGQTVPMSAESQWSGRM